MARGNLSSVDSIKITLDANHESEGLLVELMLYAPLVPVGSYLAVQGGRRPMLSSF